MPLCGVRIKEKETKGRRADKKSIEEIQVRNNEEAEEVEMERKV